MDGNVYTDERELSLIFVLKTKLYFFFFCYTSAASTYSALINAF